MEKKNLKKGIYSQLIRCAVEVLHANDAIHGVCYSLCY